MRSELAAGALLALALGCQAPTDASAEWSVVYAEVFDEPQALEGFAFTDPLAWRWNFEDGRGALELFGTSEYAPPQRSPHSIALIPELELADFDLEVELMQTGRDYGHRDMCLFFGFQSPARFYYVHLASSPDANAHNVFLVDGAPRRNLAEVAPAGIEWGREVWHRVRIERRVEAGTIEVFWDGGSEPILSTLDTSFAWGRVGVGSFDDSGRVRSIRISAPGSRPSRSEPQPF